LYNLAVSYRKSGNDNDALAGYERLLQIDTTHYKAMINCGSIYMERGQVQRARELFESAVAVRDGYWNAHLSLAEAYLEEGELDSALRHAERADTLRPGRKSIGRLLGKIRAHANVAVSN
jgi:Tfp pilus assembly protein PilF